MSKRPLRPVLKTSHSSHAPGPTEPEFTAAAGEMAKTEVDGFFHAVIVNDDLEKAYGELKTVVIDDDQ